MCSTAVPSVISILSPARLALCPNNTSSKKEEEREIKKEQLARQKRLGQIQTAKEKEDGKKLDYILIARGDKMGNSTVVGGKGYRWKGKQIRSIFKHNTNCVDLTRRGAMVLIPISIPSQANFEIVIYASGGKSGVSPLMLNFFGGKKFDGTQVGLDIKVDAIRKYIAYIESPKFPANIPMYLRVWRPANAKGSVTIKTIQYTQIKDKPEPRKPRLLPPSPRKKPKRPHVETSRAKLKENKEMRFRPYTVYRINEKAEKVLILNPEQVPMVSIITPTRDGAELLKKCYTALNQNTSYPNWEWIVGDSESSDGTAEYIKNLKDPRIKLVERGTTEGSFSTINNELAEYASGEYYLFLNDDTEPQPYWLYEMMSKINRRPDIGIVGARLMYNENKLQHAGIMFVPQGPINVGRDILSALGGEDFVKQDRFYQAVTAACLLIRAKDFNKVGKFDPIYHFCYEDVDLCLKIKNNLNKKILYAANAEVLHKESVTQKKYKTSGDLQRAGIEEFKKRWMHKVDIDFPKFRGKKKKDTQKVDITFVTCITDLPQYNSHVVGSLFMNKTNKNYEIVPILNFGNPYSAAQALNIGIDKARGEIIVLCHQDVLFYENWLEMLFDRIQKVEEKTKNWGVLGTAGITEKKDNCVGVIYNMGGTLQWQQTVRQPVWPVQTVDELCMIIRKSSGLRFDGGTFDGFHCYGPDICLNALSRNMKNYGILCPMVHNSAAGSLRSGKKDFMKHLNALARKWRASFPTIRTTTSQIRKRRIRTFIKFKS